MKKFKTLVEALKKHAGSDRGIRFLYDSNRDQFLSYNELLEEATRCLAHYQSAGVQKGDEMLIINASNRPFTIAYWACLLGGIIPVPLSFPDNQTNAMKVFGVWELLKRPWISSESNKLAEKLTAFGVKMDKEAVADNMLSHFLSFNTDAGADKASPQLIEPKADDIALIQFSSGSTGQPKGVVLTHSNLLHNVYGFVDGMGIDNKDTFLSWLPMTHDFGMIAFHLAPVVLGTEQVNIAMNSFIWNPLFWLSSTNKYRATILGSPNFGYRHFLKRFKSSTAVEESWDLSCVKMIINGAEPISTKVCQEFTETLANWKLPAHAISPGYGLAEATLVVTCTHYEEELHSYSIDRRYVSVGEQVIFLQPESPNALDVVACGKMHKYSQLRITDDNGSILPEGVVGNIEVRGHCVTSGYYYNPTATRDAMREDGWLSTQDLGFLYKGRLIFVGRIKEMIIIGGVNYFPQDIERAILNEFGEDQLNKYVACGVPNEDSGTDDLLIFVHFKSKKEDFKAIAQEVKHLVLQGVGLKVAHVIPVKNIPKTTSGKIQRFQLTQAYQEGTYDEYVKPTVEHKENQPVKIEDTYITSIKQEVESLLGYTGVNEESSFFDLGLSSIQLITLQERLEQTFKLRLSTTAALDYPTIRGLADIMTTQKLTQQLTEQQTPINTNNTNNTTNNKVTDNAPHTATHDKDSGAIAIVGVSCRFPGGANTPEQFWRLLIDEVNPVKEIPAERWQNIAHKAEQLTTRMGGFLDHIDQFDPLFFGISPKEAEAIDPQHRLLLELTWEALENAGWNPTSLSGSKTGVFVGISSNEYVQVGRDLGHRPGPYTFLGSMFNSAAGRLSYTFGFEGPSMAIDTACASSLVAVHQGILNLRSKSCDSVIAAGVNIILRDEAHSSFTTLQALSASGCCHSYDDAADGYIRSEGSAVLVLKRLEDAKRDGDHIWGVIRGSAVNHNGRSGGLTVPSGTAQQRVIHQALTDAGLTANDIDYVEGHGSATKIGDPQEVNALAAVFKDRTRPLYLGSVKSNIGHLESAAGMAGLLKVLLAMRYGEIPANLNFSKGNTLIPWKELPIKVVDKRQKWKTDSGMRLAGISSFSITGTNAHLILEGAAHTLTTPAQDDRGVYLCTLSARSEKALRKSSKLLLDWCASPTAEVADLSRHLNLGRAPLSHRVALTVNSVDMLKANLERMLSKPSSVGTAVAKNEKPVVFLFSGQGSQYHAMARELYLHSPIFKSSFEEFNSKFYALLDVSLIDLVYGEDDSYLQRPLYTQPLIFSIQMALAHFWHSLDVTPDFIIGHSIGEYAAACLDGVMTVDTAVRMVTARAKIMDSTPQNGKMVGILADVDKVRKLIEDYDDVSIAAINTPENVTVSGGLSSIEHLTKRAKKLRWFVEELDVSHPFHSVLMKDKAEQLLEELSGIQFNAPSRKLISAVTGTFAYEDTAYNAAYWSSHLVEPVNFSQAVKTAMNAGGSLFLEIGTTAALSGLAAQNEVASKRLFLPSLRRNMSEWRQLYDSLGRIWEFGLPINWSALYSGNFTRVEGLHNTPYERVNVWYSSSNITSTSAFDEVAAANVVREAFGSNEAYAVSDSVQVQVEASLGSNSSVTAIEHINEQLRDIIAQVTGASQGDIGNALPLLTLGLDSLMIVQLSKWIEEKYGVNIPVKEFFTELLTIDHISRYLLDKRHINPFIEDNISISYQKPIVDEKLAISKSVAVPSVEAYELKDIIQRQLMIMEEQLHVLHAAVNSQSTIQKPTSIVTHTKDNVALAEVKKTFSLSSDERRMYFMSSLEGGNEAHQIRLMCELTGQLDMDINQFENAFKAITKRHEMLRSSYQIEDGEIVHHISQENVTDFLKADFRIKGERELFEDFFEQPFNLAKAPLWRWSLIIDEAGKHWLYFAIHHLIADGGSINIILRDLGDYFKGKSFDLNVLPFHSFVERESELLRNGESSKQRHYWLKQLSPMPPSLDLPSDKQRPNIQKFEGEICHFTIDSHTLKLVKQIASDHTATPFMVLMAAWAGFIGRLASKEDLCIAVPYDRRINGQFANTVGMCTQTLILRLKPERKLTFSTFIKMVTDVCIGAYSHADYPFDALLEELQLPRDLSRNPLFDVMFNFENDEARVIDLGESQLRPVEYQVRYAQFDLLLDMFEREGQLHCRLNYASSLYSKSRIEGWIEQFLNYLTAVTANPNQMLSDVLMLPKAEINQLLSLASGPKGNAVNDTAVHMLADSFQAYSTQPAIWFEGQEITYQALYERVLKMSTCLNARGVQQGDKLGVLLPRTPDSLTALIATMLLGCTWVPLDPLMPINRISDMLERSDVKLVVSNSEYMQQWSSDVWTFMDIAQIEHASPQCTFEYNVQSSDLAYVLFTSGSTGRPKGVQLEHGALANFLTGMPAALDWKQGARTACLTTPSFDIFLLETLLCLTQGGCIVLANELEAVQPSQIAKVVCEGKVDHLQMTPTRLQLLCEDVIAKNAVLEQIKVLIVGGEAFPNHLLPLLQQHDQLRIFNVYGPTETCIWSTCMEVTNSQSVSIGRPIMNTNVYVLDDLRQLVSFGEEGVLWIGGAGVARGYIGQPELTQERFAQDPYIGGHMYCTGDRVRWNMNGELECLGRQDDQVKLRGYRIELGEVEGTIRRHPSVANAAVIVRELSAGNPVLMAYCQLKSEEKAKPIDIKNWVAKWLPEYSVPAFFIDVPSIPQTANGKIDRKALQALDYSSESVLNTNTLTNETNNSIETIGSTERIEDVLLNIWKKIIGERPIGIHDSFFDVGGNSFSLVLLQVELDKHFPGVVKVADLFAYSTISKLKDYINASNSRSESGENNLIKLPKAWFELGNGQNGRVEATLEKDTVSLLKEAGARYGLKLTDTLLANYALYLYKSLNNSSIPILVVNEDGKAAHVDFSFDGSTNVGTVFNNLSSALPSPDKFLTLSSFKSDINSGIRIGFTTKRVFSNKQSIRSLDLCLIAEEKDGAVSFTFEYSKLLSNSVIHEQMNRMLKMMRILANHLRGVHV